MQDETDDLIVVKLNSGAELKITPAPFAEARELYQAILAEGTVMNFDPNQEIDVNFFKDVICVGLSSKFIEEKLWSCMRRCRYKGLKIVEDVFEPVAAREDYMEVMFEVTKANITPFTKSLYAQYGHLLKEVTAKLSGNPE